MHLLLIVLVLLLIIFCILQIYRYTRSDLSIFKIATLISLHILVISFLTLSIFEPLFSFKKLVNKNTHIPILVDLSKSMSLFDSENKFNHLQDAITKFQSTNKKSKKLVYYQFGDTLDKFNDKNLKFTGKRSYFPDINSIPKDNQFSEMILLTDGNFSNAEFNHHNLADKTIHYIPLKSLKPTTKITLENPNFPLISPKDSGAHFEVQIRATEIRDPVSVIVIKDNIFEKKVDYDPENGRIDKHFRFAFKNSQEGTFIYKILLSYHDTLYDSYAFTHTVMPSKFTYSIHCPEPKIDKRFLSLTLQSDSTFQLVNTDKNPDLLILFAWDSKSQTLLNRLGPQNVVVFMGISPEKLDTINHGENISYKASEKFAIFNSYELSNFYPLSKSFFSPSLHLEPIISIIAEKEKKSREIPLLSTFSFKRANGILFSSEQLWKIDFQTLGGSPDETNNFIMSKGILALAKKILLNSRIGKFSLYQDRKLVERDSISLHCQFTEIPQNNTIEIKMELKRDDKNQMLKIPLSKVASLESSLKIGPLDEGKYPYKCSYVDNGKTYTWEDTLYILKDRAEFTGGPQNEFLLNSFASPLDLKNSEQIERLLTLNNKSSLETFTFQIRQSWFILLSLLVLLLATWFLRRLWNLD